MKGKTCLEENQFAQTTKIKHLTNQQSESLQTMNSIQPEAMKISIHPHSHKAKSLLVSCWAKEPQQLYVALSRFTSLDVVNIKSLPWRKFQWASCPMRVRAAEFHQKMEKAALFEVFGCWRLTLGAVLEVVFLRELLGGWGDELTGSLDEDL